jgi:hypothetical protein
MSLRDRILKADDLAKKEMEIPEWDVKINVCSMNGKQRSILLQKAKEGDAEGKDLVDFYSKILAMTIRDPETNELVFTEEDYDELMEKNVGVIERIVEVALKLNGLSNDSIKEAEKN